MENLTTILSSAGSILVALIVIGIILSRLYTRASKERSFVRTGLGGQKVIVNGGALVLPVLHEIIPVNMNTLRLAVSRKEQQALITKDRMRVDVLAEFYLRVKPDEDAIAIINRIAPEHLELSVEDPEAWLPNVRHAGAIFMGRYTAEALGDYCAGPNHVLPTSGTARFSSPLGVYDFQKRSSLIMCSADGASELGKTASTLARGEFLTAHARSAEYRIKD